MTLAWLASLTPTYKSNSLLTAGRLPADSQWSSLTLLTASMINRVWLSELNMLEVVSGARTLACPLHLLQASQSVWQQPEARRRPYACKAGGGVNCYLRLFKLHLVPDKQLLPLRSPSVKVPYWCSQGVSLHCCNVHNVRAALDALTL